MNWLTALKSVLRRWRWTPPPTADQYVAELRRAYQKRGVPDTVITDRLLEWRSVFTGELKLSLPNGIPSAEAECQLLRRKESPTSLARKDSDPIGHAVGAVCFANPCLFGIVGWVLAVLYYHRWIVGDLTEYEKGTVTMLFEVIFWSLAWVWWRSYRGSRTALLLPDLGGHWLAVPVRFLVQLLLAIAIVLSISFVAGGILFFFNYLEVAKHLNRLLGPSKLATIVWVVLTVIVIDAGSIFGATILVARSLTSHWVSSILWDLLWRIKRSLDRWDPRVV